MIRNDKTILSLSAALLLCFGALALAGPPDGKGKPSKGNQPVDATANFTGEDISSEDIYSSGTLLGELINNGDFDTLEGQLTGNETITVRGDAGRGLVTLGGPPHLILPPGVISVCSGTTCEVTFNVITGEENSGATWTIRLDRGRVPDPRVQFKMRWVNAAGLEHHLRIGWVVQAYDGETYPLDTDDYGTSSTNSLEFATTIEFKLVPFRIDGKVLTGKGKKTELKVFSHYGEVYDASVAPWCNMGIPPTYHDEPAPCVASTIIQTDLKVSD